MNGISDWQRRAREQGSNMSYGLAHLRQSASPEYLEDVTPQGLILLFPVREFRDRVRQIEREQEYIKRDTRVQCDGCKREFGSRHKWYAPDGALLCHGCADKHPARVGGGGVEEMEVTERDAWTNVALQGRPEFAQF